MSSSSAAIPTVIITGGSIGIGRGIAVELSKHGNYKLCLVSRNLQKLQETKRLCTEQNSNIQVLLIQCDLSNMKQLNESFTNICNEYGPINVLINNAGIGNSGYVLNADLNHWDKMIDVNFKASVHATKICLPYIIKSSQSSTNNKKCAIINISSIKGTDFGVGLSPLNSTIYSSTKQAMRIFNECLFEEVKQYGIKCCCIMPGLVKTEMLINYMKKNPNLGFSAHNILSVEDIAQSVKYVLTVSSNACPTNIVIRSQFAKL